MSDRIFIRDLEVQTVIGTLPEERNTPQKIMINAELVTDMTRAAVSDDLREAVDYSRAEALLRETAEGSAFHLLEALADALCRKMKTLSGVRQVRITLDKPGAARFARSIAVQMER